MGLLVPGFPADRVSPVCLEDLQDLLHRLDQLDLPGLLVRRDLVVLQLLRGQEDQRV